MGNKRRKLKNQLEKSPPPPSVVGDFSGPERISQRLPTPLTLVALLALCGWMSSWSNWFLYTFFTTHVKDNFGVLIAFYNLISTIPSRIILSHLRDIAWAFAIFTSALALGRIAVDSLRVDLGDWGRQLKALAVGLGLFSLALLFLGLVGWWTTPTMKALVIVPLVIGFIRYRTDVLTWIKTRDPAAWNKEVSLWEVLGFALLASYFLMNVMGALGPEYFYDSLVYHLAMPKLYLLHHRIVPTPSMIFSGVPFGTEMLYGLGLALGTESLAKLIHLGFGVATAATIYGWSKKFANRKAAILAALLFYSAPMVCFESVVATVELSMTFYLVIAALVILDVIQREPSDSASALLVLSGAMAGFGFGTKYNAGLYIPILALPLIYRSCQTERFEFKNLAGQLGFFFGAAALVSLPWMGKNWFFYHNPVFPFFHDIFGGPAANVAGLRADANGRDIGATFTTWAGLSDLLIGIWNPTAHRMDSYVGPALEIGLPWLLLARWKSIKHRGLVILVGGIWLAWTFHSTVPRFVMPAVPLFCILVANALCLIDLPRRLRLPIVGVYCYAVTVSMAAIFMMLADSGAWKVAYGRISKSDYLLHEHPAYSAPYYAGVEFINQQLPQDATVLFVGEERGYYCERKFITASVFDVNPLVDLADSSADAEELLENLKRKGITHLLVNAGSEHYQQWLKNLTPQNLGKYENLLNHGAQLIFDYNKQLAPNDRSWVQVYKLADAGHEASSVGQVKNRR